jgi:hypothetical protein
MTLLNKIWADILTHRRFYLSTAVIIVLIGTTLSTTHAGADGTRYLRWTHSLVFDQDLHLKNDFEAVGGSYRFTPTKFVFELATIGGPLLWAPFYAVGSFAPWLWHQKTTGLPAESPLQIIWINFSAWLYLTLAGILTTGALKHYFSRREIAVAGIAVLVGTPLLFYVITFPYSAHATMVFLSALFLYLWISPGDKPNLWRYLGLGVVGGWLMATAGYNVVFILLPGVNLLTQFFQNRRASLKGGLVLGTGWILGFSPQWTTNWFLFTNPLYSPYSGQLFWAEPYLLETWFSPFHGLFIYSPVLLLAIPGIFIWAYRFRAGAIALGLAWLALSYLVSINIAWWAGTSFGNRYFLTLSPFFVLMLAALVQKGQQWVLAPILIATLWTMGLYLQYMNGVRFTSDSIVLPLNVLARGQMAALQNSPSLLLKFAANRPWANLPWVTLPVMALALLGVSRWAYNSFTGSISHRSGQIIAGVGLVVLFFMVAAGIRGQHTVAKLTTQGYFNQPYEVIQREVKEVAGKAGLVTRAMYYRSVGQPEKAIADLQLASQLWKQPGVPVATRLYLGPPEAIINIPHPLHLDYSGVVRLIGYRLEQVTPTNIQGDLYWQNLTADEAKETLTPLIRGFDRNGQVISRTQIKFPFPAYYIPAENLFRDSFMLSFDPPPDGRVWLEVSLPEFLDLPQNEAGEIMSGFIAMINLGAPQPDIVPSTQVCSAAEDFAATICTLIRSPVSRRYEPMVPDQPIHTTLTPGVELAGYDFSVIPQPSAMQAQITLYWHITANMMVNFVPSLQLVNANNQIVLNRPHIPVNGVRPTNTWRAGEWVVDTQIIEVPVLASGQYRLQLTLLNSKTNNIIPLIDGSQTLFLQEIPIP